MLMNIRSQPEDGCPNECEFEFSAEQKWLDLPANLVFVNDAGDSESTGTFAEDNETIAIGEPDISQRSEVSHGTRAWEEYNATEVFLGSPSTVYNTSNRWLTTAEEASLFRHFLEGLGPWFDMNDDEKTFTRELIRKAPTSPILLTAILALASRHLATVSSFDSKIADHYSEECTTEMISCLNNRDESKNDDLFAATIILRTKEEMDAYSHGSDQQAHLLGIKAFTHSDWFASPPSPLRECTYWSALRQEINFALVRQRPLDINLHINFVRRESFDLTVEKDWSNCCTLNLAHIIMFCFEYHQRSPTEFQVLRNALTELCDAFPATYNPFYYSRAASASVSPFPQIWFASEAAGKF
ncbi:hypothetical protein OHC33_001291 [Knufia fluminis]|uniref:Transcription factor domain-containing protein n=1 Tax=Knufia fluminis TaxID=191047 RepID=A0AAN8IC81_9EURO|nr:hypothetical protein OHC33_001291 [Knufia fluminis]